MTSWISQWHVYDFNPPWHGASDTTVCDKISEWFTADLWVFPTTPAFSINKADSHVITKILLYTETLTLNTKCLIQMYTF
jgi:hypothetical protein